MKDFQRIGEFLMESIIPPTSPYVSEHHSKSYESAIQEEVKAGFQTEKALPTATQDENCCEKTAIGLSCKVCGKSDSLNAQSGKYGYYVKCGHCESNTSMRISCPSCGGNQTKASKRGNEYWLSCPCSFFEKLYEQR